MRVPPETHHQKVEQGTEQEDPYEKYAADRDVEQKNSSQRGDRYQAAQ
jgi:hypothetical protein